MDQEDLKCLQGHFVLHEVALSVHWFVYVEARGRRLGEFPARTIRRVCGAAISGTWRWSNVTSSLISVDITCITHGLSVCAAEEECKSKGPISVQADEEILPCRDLPLLPNSNAEGVSNQMIASAIISQPKS